MDLKNHPRFRNYIQHHTYSCMFPMYKPFVNWVNEPMFRSEYVNTDATGLRFNYTPEGSLIDLHQLKSSFIECDVIIGGSTVFGVDAISDRTTISHGISTNDVPCINLGVRGVTSYQELFLFILLQSRFPKIRRIYLCTGVNDCSLASLEGSLIYDEFGGFFGQDHYMTYPYINNFSACYDDQSFNRLKLYNAIERKYRDGGIFKILMRKFFNYKYPVEPIKNSLTDMRKSFEAKINQNILNLSNILSTWKKLSDGHGAELHYFLQPCIQWNTKKLSSLEQECFDADKKISPNAFEYAKPAFHTSYSKSVKALCENAGIPFHDTNAAIDTLGADVDIFTDVCHLTDSGNRVVADFIRQKSNA